jgi:predicted kinase
LLARLRLDSEQTALRGQAQAYFDSAMRFLNSPRPLLIAIGGLSGTGKSTLAAAIAPLVGAAPGAVHLRSDVQRKRFFGVAETTHLPAEAYRPEISARVYSRLAELARAGLNASRAVIVDATYHHLNERGAIAAIARELGIRFIGLWLEAPTAILQERVSLRRNDASDATAAVVDAQAREPIGSMSWHRLDASRTIERMQAAALKQIPDEFVFSQAAIRSQ